LIRIEESTPVLVDALSTLIPRNGMSRHPGRERLFPMRQSPSTCFRACSYSAVRGVSLSNAFSCTRTSIKPYGSTHILCSASETRRLTSVWGADPESLDAVARRLDAGTVWINQHLNVHPNIPFSGHKNSGIGIEFGEDGSNNSAMCRSLRTNDRR
jgi:hypothetical protein